MPLRVRIWGNSRNGGYKITIALEFGNLEITAPRDRNSTFEPVILPKGETRFTGFDDKNISISDRYSQGNLHIMFEGRMSFT